MMDKFSYLGNADTSSIEDLFQQYLKDSNSVDSGWQKFFEGFEFIHFFILPLVG